MNREILKRSEDLFLMRYPDGFDDPRLMAVSKKHKLDKMYDHAKEIFGPDRFDDPQQLIEECVKLISRSSLVSVFVKTALRNLIKDSEMMFKIALADSLREMVHGDQKRGFEAVAECLGEHRLAKWTILTVVLLYMDPEHEVFIKPTTVKNVIKFFELDGIEYSSKVNFDFYKGYRERFVEMRGLVHPMVGRDNAVFSGFLMMAMQMSQE